MTNQTNTNGGASVGGNVNTGGDFVGRDKIMNIGKSLRDEQYQIALNWDKKLRMRGFDLAGRDLSGLNLVNADLSGANLEMVDLTGTKLQGAKLMDANLQGAKLIEVSLQGANLFGANLIDANLTGSQLSERPLIAELALSTYRPTVFVYELISKKKVLHIIKANFDKTIYNSKTIWPDGFDPVAAGAILVED